MSKNAIGTSEMNSLESISAVGGVRAHRMRRDLGFESVLDVAEASLETLQEVWSVGPHFARVIKGSAEELVEAWRSEQSLESERRIAVVAGNEAFEQLDDRHDPVEVIEGALRMADIEIDDRTRIGYVEDGMGGLHVERWSAYEAAREGVRRQPFETPWEKYMRFIDPLRYVDDEFCEKHNISDIDEVPAGRMPERVSLKTGIPFNVDRADDVDKWMAPAERTQNMVRWADEVVIALDGEHAEKFQDTCDYENTPCSVGFKLQGSVLRVADEQNEAKEEVDRSYTIPDVESYGQRDVREGSPADLDTEPDGVHMNSEHADEEARVDRNDLDGADPGGSGVGSQRGRWR